MRCHGAQTTTMYVQSHGRRHSSPLARRRLRRADVLVVLDPVGAGATRLRTETAKRILDEAEIAVVRGNAAEVATLAGREAEIRGVESIGAADSGGRVGEGRSEGARLRRVRDRPGRPRVRRRAHDRGRERGRAARHGQRTGCMSTAITGCFSPWRPIDRSRPQRRRSSRSASRARTLRSAQRGRERSTPPVRRALQPRPGDARRAGEGSRVRLHAIVTDFETRDPRGRRRGDRDPAAAQGRFDRRRDRDRAAVPRPARDVRRQRRRRGGARAGRGRRPPRPRRPGAERARRARAHARDLGLERRARHGGRGAGAAYIGAGPVWATPSKPDADPPIGLDGLRCDLRGGVDPSGRDRGIDATNAADCIAAGAAGVAVVRAAARCEGGQ